MRLQICALMTVSLLLTACSGYGSSGSGSVASPSNSSNQNQGSSVPNVNMAAIKTSVTSAQTAITSAQAALNQIVTESGMFNFSALIGGVNFGDLSSCVSAQFQPSQLLFLPEDIANALSCVLNDVVTVARTAKTDMANATAELNLALLSVPAGSAEAVEIQSMITQVSTLQVNYVKMITSLAQQLNLISSGLNSLSSLASGVCPMPGLSFVCGAAVSLLLEPIQSAITTFQTQMETL
jgi:hypothetical protein